MQIYLQLRISRWDRPGLSGWALHGRTKFLQATHRGEAGRRGTGCVKAETETVAMQPEVKEYLELPGARKAQKNLVGQQRTAKVSP